MKQNIQQALLLVVVILVIAWILDINPLFYGAIGAGVALTTLDPPKWLGGNNPHPRLLKHLSSARTNSPDNYIENYANAIEEFAKEQNIDVSNKDINIYRDIIEPFKIANPEEWLKHQYYINYGYTVDEGLLPHWDELTSGQDLSAINDIATLDILVRAEKQRRAEAAENRFDYEAQYEYIHNYSRIVDDGRLPSWEVLHEEVPGMHPTDVRGVAESRIDTQTTLTKSASKR